MTCSPGQPALRRCCVLGGFVFNILVEAVERPLVPPRRTSALTDRISFFFTMVTRHTSMCWRRLAAVSGLGIGGGLWVVALFSSVSLTSAWTGGLAAAVTVGFAYLWWWRRTWLYWIGMRWRLTGLCIVGGVLVGWMLAGLPAPSDAGGGPSPWLIATGESLVALWLAHEWTLAVFTTETAEAVRVQVPPAQGSRIVMLAGGGLVVALAGGHVYAHTSASVIPLVTFLPAAIALFSTSFTATGPRTVWVTDQGIRIARRIYPWGQFSEFTLNGQTLLLHRTGPRPTLTYDLQKVNQRAQVAAALQQYLRRRSTHLTKQQ